MALARISDLGVQKIHIWGELGVQFFFIPLHYNKKKDIRVSTYIEFLEKQI